MKREFRHNGVKWEMTEQLEFQTLINSDPELNYTVSRDALLRLNIINVIIFNLLGGKWMPFDVSVLLMWRLKIFFLNCMFVIKSYNTIIWSWVISMQKDAKNVKEKKCFETKLKKNGSTKNIQLSRNKTL